MNVVLNRLEITGSLDDFTPLVVIIEILDSHGIEYDSKSIKERRYINKIIDTLTVSSKVIISYPYTKEAFKLIGRYINPYEKWDTLKLIEAADFMVNFKFNVPDDFKYGYQSNSNPYCLNSCMLYRLCRNIGIKTYRQTTLEEMANCLKLYNSDPTILKKMINLDSLGKADLVNIINIKPFNISDMYPTDKIEYDLLLDALSELGTVKLGRIMPRSNNESVILAAINYKVDISTCDLPLKEYLKIHNNPESFNLEHPMWSKNKELFYLSSNFNGNLPFALYAENDLRALAKIEGINEQDLIAESCYTELQTRALSNNFYLGFRPEIVNTKTLIYDSDISKLKNNEIVSYGILGQRLTAYTWEELYDCFKNYRNFNGCDNKPFENIIKLKNLSINEDPELFKLISEIEFEKSCIDDKVRLLRESYQKCKLEVIPRTVKLIFDLGMYMRGWNGIGEYPIEQAPQEDSIIIELKLTEEFIKLDKCISELELITVDNVNMKSLFLELPLIRFAASEFQASNDTHEKLTLFDRLELVKKGESVSNMASCIRMSSNWIVASGYYYLMGLGIPPRFNINCLASIS